MKEDVMTLVRPNILDLEPYSTARDDYKGGVGIFLDANENPFENGFNRYPDPHQTRLKAMISKIRGIPVEQMFIGNGSDEAIDLCYRIFCVPGRDNAVIIAPSYGMYGVAAAINDVEVRKVQLEDDYSLPTARLLAACDRNTKLIMVCSPNNPTGNAFPISEIASLAAAAPCVLVVDEAYVDFSDKGSATELLDRFDNLIVLQTLSKAYGMAGLRLGLAFMQGKVARLFANVKYPYNIDTAAMQQAFSMLGRDIASEVEEIVAERNRVGALLPMCSCVEKVWPSDANFLLVKATDPKELYDALIGRQVIVRDRSRVKGCEGCLRITVGTRAENDIMLETIQKFR